MIKLLVQQLQQKIRFLENEQEQMSAKLMQVHPSEMASIWEQLQEINRQMDKVRADINNALDTEL